MDSPRLFPMVRTLPARYRASRPGETVPLSIERPVSRTATFSLTATVSVSRRSSAVAWSRTVARSSSSVSQCVCTGYRDQAAVSVQHVDHSPLSGTAPPR